MDVELRGRGLDRVLQSDREELKCLMGAVYTGPGAGFNRTGRN